MPLLKIVTLETLPTDCPVGSDFPHPENGEVEGLLGIKDACVIMMQNATTRINVLREELERVIVEMRSCRN